MLCHTGVVGRKCCASRLAFIHSQDRRRWAGSHAQDSGLLGQAKNRDINTCRRSDMRDKNTWQILLHDQDGRWLFHPDSRTPLRPYGPGPVRSRRRPVEKRRLYGPGPVSFSCLLFFVFFCFCFCFFFVFRSYILFSFRYIYKFSFLKKLHILKLFPFERN